MSEWCAPLSSCGTSLWGWGRAIRAHVGHGQTQHFINPARAASTSVDQGRGGLLTSRSAAFPQVTILESPSMGVFVLDNGETQEVVQRNRPNEGQFSWHHCVIANLE
jgi:hypothetical protein